MKTSEKRNIAARLQNEKLEKLQSENKLLKKALQELTDECKWISKDGFTRTGLTRFKEVMKQSGEVLTPAQP